MKNIFLLPFMLFIALGSKAQRIEAYLVINVSECEQCYDAYNYILDLPVNVKVIAQKYGINDLKQKLLTRVEQAVVDRVIANDSIHRLHNAAKAMLVIMRDGEMVYKNAIVSYLSDKQKIEAVLSFRDQQFHCKRLAYDTLSNPCSGAEIGVSGSKLILRNKIRNEITVLDLEDTTYVRKFPIEFKNDFLLEQLAAPLDTQQKELARSKAFDFYSVVYMHSVIDNKVYGIVEYRVPLLSIKKVYKPQYALVEVDIDTEKLKFYPVAIKEKYVLQVSTFSKIDQKYYMTLRVDNHKQNKRYPSVAIVSPPDETKAMKIEKKMPSRSPLVSDGLFTNAYIKYGLLVYNNVWISEITKKDPLPSQARLNGNLYNLPLTMQKLRTEYFAINDIFVENDILWIIHSNTVLRGLYLSAHSLTDHRHLFEAKIYDYDTKSSSLFELKGKLCGGVCFDQQGNLVFFVNLNDSDENPDYKVAVFNRR